MGCDLGWSIGMVLRNYRAKTEAVTAEVPRGARGYQLLYAVIHSDLPNQLLLAEYLGIDRTVLPYVIDDLVEAGLVERQPTPGDRRGRKVVATPLGITTFEKLERQMLAAEEALLATLNTTEQQEFRRLLSRVARQAREDTAVMSSSEPREAP